MGIAQTIRSYFGLEERADPALNFQDWVNYFSFNNNMYPYGLQTTIAGDREEIVASFGGFVAGAYKANGIVFACIQARAALLSQARFQFQQMREGQPGDLFGKPALELLEHPEPGKVTADLLASASVDVDLAGNHFLARRSVNGALRLKRLQPDWVTIVSGSPNPNVDLDTRDIDAEVLGYIYHPGGRHSGIEPEVLLRDSVAHLAPIKDPSARNRGMSWLTPIVREIEGDSAATQHKIRFFDNGATVNLIVQTGEPNFEKFKEWVRLFREGHEGVANANKTLFLTPGADAKAIGADFQQMDFKAMQGADEVRIAMASGIHPVILGASEGLQGSSLNQGNFMAARRLVADMTLRPWWGNFSASLEVIIPPPASSRLWYDDRHIQFLAEDIKDQAEVQSTQAGSIATLFAAGAEWDAAVDAITSFDLKRLKGKHTGLSSVQLQPPESDDESEPIEPVAASGNGVPKPAVPEA